MNEVYDIILTFMVTRSETFQYGNKNTQGLAHVKRHNQHARHWATHLFILFYLFIYLFIQRLQHKTKI